MYLPGLCSVTFRQLAAEEVVALAAESGLAGIEWGGDVHVPPGDLANAAEVRRLTLAADLAVASYGSYYRLGEATPHAFAACLATARELGAPTLRVWAGRQGSAEVGEAERARLTDEARRIADGAANAGIVVALEYHGHSLTDTPASAIRLLSEVNRPNLRTYWQTPIGSDLAACLADLRQVQPWLHGFHCFHWAGAKPEPRPLADGEALWRQLLAQAGTSLESAWVLLEFVRGGTHDQFRDDAAVLSRLVNEPR